MGPVKRLDIWMLGTVLLLLGLTQALHFGVIPMPRPVTRFVYGYIYGRLGMVAVVLICLWVGLRYRQQD